jgi:hypothetical protein
MTFFAVHKSGVIDWILPCLYEVTKSFACSRLVDEVNNVLSIECGQPIELEYPFFDHNNLIFEKAI